VHADRRGRGAATAAADYFHRPAGTRHVIVGAGDGPSTILMIGARPEVETFRYPVSEVTAKYGASAAKETGGESPHGTGSAVASVDMSGETAG
jgi:hypothetical protein